MQEMPVYVRIRTPTDVVELMKKLKVKIIETKNQLEKISILVKEEESKISEWNGKFNSINEKIITLQNNLLKPESV